MKLQEAWEKNFNKEFVNSYGHLDFTDEDGFFHLQKPTKIKTFISSLLKSTHNTAIEQALEMVKNYKFQTYEANTALIDGNVILSNAGSVKNLIKMTDLQQAVEASLKELIKP